MTRRFLMLIPFLALLVARLSIGAIDSPSNLQKSKNSPPPQAETEKVPPITILSIIPAQGEPGISVTLYGTGFSQRTTVFLGSAELPAKVVSSKQLSFDIPKLDPGLYALYLKREDGTTSRPYNFTLLPQKPVAIAVTPDTIYACSTGRDREATVTGHNFQEGSQVLFDGAAIGGRVSSSEAISFTVPLVADGLHQVQVRNPQDTFSVVLGLVIDGRPEITSVSRGNDYTTYYDLIIEGKNFRQNSALVVMEERTLEETPSGVSVDVKRITSSSGSTTDREQIVVVNCNRIIYQRYPYSNTTKSFRVQVVNSGGNESALVSVSAP